MRKIMMLWTTVLLVFFLAACSGSSNSGGNDSAGNAENSASSSADRATGDSGNIGFDDRGKADRKQSAAESSSSEQPNNGNTNPTTERMVIYTAHMTVTVEKFEEARNHIQSLISESGGYIVESSIHRTENDKQRGRMTARIPQQKFQAFLAQVKEVADTVKERNVNGRDVTKQYIDLQSRLKAKIAVKERLNQFLEKAKDSDSLLDISNQLAKVQEEIEHIKGEMKYLENHSALATVSIMLLETDTGLKQQEDLDTWGKTKQAFVDSINTLISFASGLFVFFIGYSPILIILIVIAVIIYVVYRRRKRKES